MKLSYRCDGKFTFPLLLLGDLSKLCATFWLQYFKKDQFQDVESSTYNIYITPASSPMVKTRAQSGDSSGDKNKKHAKLSSAKEPKLSPNSIASQMRTRIVDSIRSRAGSIKPRTRIEMANSLRTFLATHEPTLPGVRCSDIFTCPICMQSLVMSTLTPCGHTFCLKCLDEASCYSAGCPICRVNIRGEYFKQSKAFETISREYWLASTDRQDYLERVQKNREWAARRVVRSSELKVKTMIDVRLDSYKWLPAEVTKVDKKTVTLRIYNSQEQSVRLQTIPLPSRRLASFRLFSKEVDLIYKSRYESRPVVHGPDYGRRDSHRHYDPLPTDPARNAINLEMGTVGPRLLSYHIMRAINNPTNQSILQEYVMERTARASLGVLLNRHRFTEHNEEFGLNQDASSSSSSRPISPEESEQSLQPQFPLWTSQPSQQEQEPHSLHQSDGEMQQSSMLSEPDEEVNAWESNSSSRSFFQLGYNQQNIIVELPSAASPVSPAEDYGPSEASGDEDYDRY